MLVKVDITNRCKRKGSIHKGWVMVFIIFFKFSRLHSVKINPKNYYNRQLYYLEIFQLLEIEVVVRINIFLIKTCKQAPTKRDNGRERHTLYSITE